MIHLHNLSKTYKGQVTALRGISLDITQPGIFGLLGVNGAGKTTLMRILAGLLNASGGEATVFGNNLLTRQGQQATKGLLGYLPQEFGTYPNLTAREFLDYMAILKGITATAVRQRDIQTQLERTNLLEVADRPMSGYSGGMKRRVGIAQALLGQPKLLIVDEPTAGLDPEERIRFRNLLAQVAQNTIIILSTHIVEDINHSCYGLAVMNKGQVIFAGSPAELISQARGKVWHVVSQETNPPQGDYTLVSTRQLQDGIQYRLLGPQPAGAQAVEPGLEDGYMWLMNHR